jgi:predicted nucleotidyltransferase
MNNRYEIAREFVKAIASDNIIKTILFGSVARGDDTDESDIDILIIIHTDNRQMESMIDKKVVDFILEKEEVISPHVMTEEHFNKTKDYSFLQNVMAEGVVI